MGRSCSGCRLQRPITLQPRVSRVCRCHAGRIPKDLSTFRESRARTPLRACRVIDKRGGEQSSLLKTGRDVQLGKTVGTREYPSFAKEGNSAPKRKQPRSLAGTDGVVVSSHRLSKPFGMDNQ